MPSDNLCGVRNKIVSDFIFKVGRVLKQNMVTINLAIKLFDILFVH